MAGKGSIRLKNRVAILINVNTSLEIYALFSIVNNILSTLPFLLIFSDIYKKNILNSSFKIWSVVSFSSCLVSTVRKVIYRYDL